MMATATVATESPTPLDRSRQVLNVTLAVAQVAAIVLQAQSAFGADLSQRGPDAPVVPAAYTFAIWGPIYLLSFAYAVYQALPEQGARPLHRRVGWWTAAAFAASSLWALAAAAPAPWVTWGTVAMIFALFAGLLGAFLNATGFASSRWDRPLVVGATGLYLGYITLATVANTASSLWQSGIRTPLSLSESAWAVAMLVIAGGIASAVVVRGRGRLAYSTAVVWGLIGVAVQNFAVTPNPVIGVAASLAAVAVALTTLLVRSRARLTA